MKESYGDYFSIAVNLMFIVALISLFACSSVEWDALLSSFFGLFRFRWLWIRLNWTSRRCTWLGPLLLDLGVTFLFLAVLQ